MKRLLFLILIVLCGFVEMHAIKYDVYVRTQTVTQGSLRYLRGVRVMSVNCRIGRFCQDMVAFPLPQLNDE